MQELYEDYLRKHKTEPFVMLDEMDLTFDEFVDRLDTCYVFRLMWSNAQETNK